MINWCDVSVDSLKVYTNKLIKGVEWVRSSFVRYFFKFYLLCFRKYQQ